MFRNTPFASVPTYKLILGFSLCTLGGAMLYSYFKSRDEDNNDEGATSQKDEQSKRTGGVKPAVTKDVCLKMIIANDHIPLIIGRAGANLKRIEEKTTTKIRLRDKDSGNKFCDINGQPEAVKAARALIFKEIERAPIIKEELQLPLNVAQKLNERGGETIQEICRKSLAKITVEQNGRNGKTRITIVGNQKQVNIAHKLLEDQLEEDEELRRAVAEVEQKREPRRSPTNSINSSMYSSQNSLSSHLPPRDKLLAARNDEKPMEVYVSAVASPSKFWVQLVGPQSKKLDEMVQDMTDYYTVEENRAKHVLKEPYVGQIVAGVFKYDDKWYRAEIVEIIPNEFNPNETVIDLYFVDYGDSEYVSPQDVYELRTDFLTLRFQAVECFLANVKSTITATPNSWTNQSTQKFEEFTEVANWKKLIARVVTYKERPKPKSGVALNAASREGAPLPGVELFDPTEGMDLNLGNMLISHGFALPLEDSLPRSRSYTPTSNGSDSTIEEITNTPTTPLSPMTRSLNTDNNNFVDSNASNVAEDAHFAQQLQHLKQKNLYLNVDGEIAGDITNASPAKLSADFHNGNSGDVMTR